MSEKYEKIVKLHKKLTSRLRKKNQEKIFLARKRAKK